MSYCKVTQCRFSNTHTTKAHVCGVCKTSGHGEIECYHHGRRVYLLQFHNETLPNDMHCTIADCTSKEFHTVEAHHCPSCHLRIKHTSAECHQLSQNTINNVTYYIKCPVCREENIVTNPKKILGLSDSCCICMTNNVEILMPSCYHVCVCLDCLKQLYLHTMYAIMMIILLSCSILEYGQKMQPTQV